MEDTNNIIMKVHHRLIYKLKKLMITSNYPSPQHQKEKDLAQIGECREMHAPSFSWIDREFDMETQSQF
jgi:hypothetical protein